MAAGDERRKSAFVLARIKRVQRRLNLETALAAAVVPAWVAVTLLAMWRFVVQRQVAPAALVLVVGAALAWRWLTRRGGVTLDQAAVIADRRANAGGLLLTRLETGVGAWELGLNERVRALTPPPIRVRRSVAGLSLALLFCAVALLVPLPPRVVHPVNAAAATKLDDVQEKLDAVAKEEPLDDATAAELERLREELADHAFDAADWEAADTLDKELDRKAQEAAAELSRAEEAAKALSEAMAAAQKGESPTREQEALERALMQLSDGQAADADQAMAQALGEEKPPAEKKEGEGKEGKEGTQGKEGQQSGKQESGKQNGGPSQSRLSELQQALQNRQQQLQKTYGQPQQQQAQQGTGKGEGKGKGKGEGSGEGGEDGRGKGDGKTGEKQGTGKEHASRAMGEGGPSHGEGDDRDLVYGGRAEIDPERLKFQPLPQGQGGEDPGALWGLKAANPKKNSVGHAASGSGAGATGEQAPGNREGLLLPRNRALIQKYFDTAPRKP